MSWLIYALGGWFWFLLIVQIVIIIITIRIATSKGYSGILAFLLGLFIPLLGSLIIVALLPDQNSRYSYGRNSSREDTPNVSKSIDNFNHLIINSQYRVKKQEIELFENPNITSPIIIKIQYNDIVTLIEIGEKLSEYNFWCYVENDKGMKGWCYFIGLENI
jgi:hypothetical protein